MTNADSVTLDQNHWLLLRYLASIFTAKVGGTSRNSAGGAKETGKWKAAMPGTRATDEITVIVYAKDSITIKKAVKMLTDLLEKETMRKDFSDSIVMRMDRNTVCLFVWICLEELCFILLTCVSPLQHIYIYILDI